MARNNNSNTNSNRGMTESEQSYWDARRAASRYRSEAAAFRSGVETYTASLEKYKGRKEEYTKEFTPWVKAKVRAGIAGGGKAFVAPRPLAPRTVKKKKKEFIGETEYLSEKHEELETKQTQLVSQQAKVKQLYLTAKEKQADIIFTPEQTAETLSEKDYTDPFGRKYFVVGGELVGVEDPIAQQSRLATPLDKYEYFWNWPKLKKLPTLRPMPEMDISVSSTEYIKGRGSSVPIQETISITPETPKIFLPSGEMIAESMSEVHAAKDEDLSFMEKVHRKSEQVEGYGSKGNIFAPVAGFGLGLVASGATTVGFAKEFFAQPDETIYSLITSIPQIPGAIARGVQVAGRKPGYAAGFVVGEVLTTKGIGKWITWARQPKTARYVGLTDDAGITKGISEVKPRVGQPQLYEVVGKKVGKIDKVDISAQVSKGFTEKKVTAKGISLSRVTGGVTIGKETIQETISATLTKTPEDWIKSVGRSTQYQKGRFTAVLGEETIILGRTTRTVPYKGIVIKTEKTSGTTQTISKLKTIKQIKPSEQIGKAIQESEMVARKPAPISKAPPIKMMPSTESAIKTSQDIQPLVARATQKMDLATKTSYKLKNITKTKQNTKAKQGLKQKIAQKQTQDTKQKLISGRLVKGATKYAQKYRQRAKTKQKTQPKETFIPKFTPAKYTPKKILKFGGKDKSIKLEKKKKKSKIQRMAEYKPSLIGLTMPEIKATPAKRFTGVGIRRVMKR